MLDQKWRWAQRLDGEGQVHLIYWSEEGKGFTACGQPREINIKDVDFGIMSAPDITARCGNCRRKGKALEVDFEALHSLAHARYPRDIPAARQEYLRLLIEDGYVTKEELQKVGVSFPHGRVPCTWSPIDRCPVLKQSNFSVPLQQG